MPRKRLTQIFPWLLPLRIKQRLFCFYAKMRLDRNRYAAIKSGAPLPYQLFETSCPLYNRETGFDMVYQENKVFNLKLAAATLNKVIIGPNETFSFWKLVRYADRDIPYKDGLTVVDGKLTTAPGGGMCQMSNLLSDNVIFIKGNVDLKGHIRFVFDLQIEPALRHGRIHAYWRITGRLRKILYAMSMPFLNGKRCMKEHQYGYKFVGVHMLNYGISPDREAHTLLVF